MVTLLSVSAVLMANRNHVQATSIGVAPEFSCEQTERGNILYYSFFTLLLSEENTLVLQSCLNNTGWKVQICSKIFTISHSSLFCLFMHFRNESITTVQHSCILISKS
jgi:hypothetical protein